MKVCVVSLVVAVLLQCSAVQADWLDDDRNDDCVASFTCGDDEDLMTLLDTCWYTFYWADAQVSFSSLRKKRSAWPQRQQESKGWPGARVWYDRDGAGSGRDQGRDEGRQDGDWSYRGQDMSSGGWMNQGQQRNDGQQGMSSGGWMNQGQQRNGGQQGMSFGGSMNQGQRGNDGQQGMPFGGSMNQGQQRNDGRDTSSWGWNSKPQWAPWSWESSKFRGWGPEPRYDEGPKVQGYPWGGHYPVKYPEPREWNQYYPSPGNTHNSFQYKVPKPAYRRSFREGNWHLDNKHLIKNYYKKGTYETAKKYFIALPFVKIIPVTTTKSVDYVGHLQTYNGYEARLCEKCHHGAPQIEFKSLSNPYKNVIRRFNFLPETERTRTEYGTPKIVQTGEARIHAGKETSRQVPVHH